jgi:hypothetical protein
MDKQQQRSCPCTSTALTACLGYALKQLHWGMLLDCMLLRHGRQCVSLCSVVLCCVRMFMVCL